MFKGYTSSKKAVQDQSGMVPKKKVRCSPCLTYPAPAAI